MVATHAKRNNMEKSKIQGHVAIITANVIFGLSIPVTSDLLAHYFTPNGNLLFRSSGAAILFWIIAAFMPREKVERKDLWVIIAGGLMGGAISQLCAAWSLNYTNPVYYSFMATLTPIVVMLMAALLIKEKITALKAVGVVIGIAGALLMVFSSWQSGSGSNDLLGIFFALMALVTWALYLIITRKVSVKYTSLTQMKWMWLVSAIFMVAVSWSELPAQQLWTSSSMAWGIAEMAFIIVFATVVGFFMIPYAMKRLQATTVSVYTNLQPVVASIVAFVAGQATLTWDKPVAGVLILLSAYIVTVAAAGKKA